MLICVTWTTARIMFNVVNMRQPNSVRLQGKLTEAPPRLRNEFSSKDVRQPLRQRVFAERPTLAKSPYLSRWHGSDVTAGLAFDDVPLVSAERILGGSALTVPRKGTPLSAEVYILSAPHSTKQREPRSFEIYAYSFWRKGDNPLVQVGNGQYGGSQSALLLTVPMRRFGNAHNASRLALISRASVAHGNVPEREMAAGLKWQPVKSVPAAVIAERRFRHNRPDAIAAFVAGGHDGVAMPMGFMLDGYGQAGLLTGKNGGAFADVQLKAIKPLAELRGAAISAGGGIWGGGQDKLMRIDLGPSFSATLPIGDAQMRIDTSWRFRIAGKAKPGNGPALTLSTSF